MPIRRLPAGDRRAHALDDRGDRPRPDRGRARAALPQRRRAQRRRPDRRGGHVRDLLLLAGLGLAKAGEIERAEALFDQLAGYANDLGLLAEEIDTANGELLGNFPQAFSHIGLITAAWEIDKARGVVTTPPPPPAAKRAPPPRSRPRRGGRAGPARRGRCPRGPRVYYGGESPVHHAPAREPGRRGAPPRPKKRPAPGARENKPRSRGGGETTRGRRGAPARGGGVRVREGGPRKDPPRISRLGATGAREAGDRRRSLARPALQLSERRGRGERRVDLVYRPELRPPPGLQARADRRGLRLPLRPGHKTDRGSRRLVRQAQRACLLTGRADALYVATPAPTRNRAATTLIARTT